MLRTQWKRLACCILAVVLTLTCVPMTQATAYTNLQEAVDDAGAGVVQLWKNEETLTVSKDVVLDLNGYNIQSVTVSGGTLRVLDSQTDDYTGSYGKIASFTGDVQAQEGYLMDVTSGVASFHKVGLTITAMSLRSVIDGEALPSVYYTSTFAGDEVVAKNVKKYGIALNAMEEPSEKNMNTSSAYSAFTNFQAGENKGNGTLLKGIMKTTNTDARNLRNANIQVYGRAYVLTHDDQYIFGNSVHRSLKEQMEAVDELWSTYNPTVRENFRQLYDAYEDIVKSWNLSNLFMEVPDTLTWEDIDAIPVATNDMTEEQLRQICVDFMRLQTKVFWRPSHDVKNNLVTDGLYEDLLTTNVYQSLPYKGGHHASLYGFMHFYDEKTGILDLSGGEATMKLISNQCSSSVSWAWNRIGIHHEYTQNSTVANGCLRVGPYTYDDSITEFTTENNTYDICQENGRQIMYQSYAAMEPGDGLVQHRNGSGHNMMASGKPVVVKNADGTIDDKNSYVPILDKQAIRIQQTAPNGDAYLDQGFLDTKVYFNQLFAGSYLPFTFAELNKQTPVEKSKIELKNDQDNPTETYQNGKTITKERLTEACMFSNYGISDFTITVKDADGAVVLEKWCAAYGPLHVREKVALKVHFTAADYKGLPAGRNNTVEIVARLGSGELVTVFSGKLSV